MPVRLQTKYGKKVLAIVGCFAVWLLYTLIFRQIIRFDDNNNVPAKNLDLKQETYEIDQRVSVCFKDVAPFSMLLKHNTNVCRNIHDLLIVVHTDPTDLQLRAEFRKTLRKVKKEGTIYNLQIDTVFMLGLDKDQCISSVLLQEMSLEKDILISSFIDSNENQTIKSVNTLKWFYENCSHSKLLLKLDGGMDPSTSFSTKQFHKFLKAWSNEDIVLLGSRSLPNLFSKNDPVSYLSSTTTSSNPISAQYLHLNYLLSRNVVMSLLKARADAINISAWKEDLFVTGVLANVAQIRPKHDERFLRQCAGTLCIFCECLEDLDRQTDFSRPYYFAQSLIQREESAQRLESFMSETDSTRTWSPMQHESMTETDRTLLTSTNGAETFSTELSTLTSTRSSFIETTTIPQSEFTTSFKTIGEGITVLGGLPTTTNIPDSTIFPQEKTETSEISSHFAELSYTTTEQYFQSLESENFIVTASTLNGNLPSSTLTESLDNKITDLGRLTTDTDEFYKSTRGYSHTTETDVTQSSIMNVRLDTTIGTTPQEAYDLFPSTRDEKLGTNLPPTLLEFTEDSTTISTSYPITDPTTYMYISTETEGNPVVTLSSISDEFVSTINVVLKNGKDEFTEDEEQGFSSTNTVGMTNHHIETTTPTYWYETEDGSPTANSQRASFIGGNWSGNMQQNFKQTTTTQAAKIQSEILYESSSAHIDATTEDLSRATTTVKDAVGKAAPHSPLLVTLLKSGKENFSKITAPLEEKLLTESTFESTSAKLDDIPSDLSLTTNFQTDESTTQDTSAVSKNVILEEATPTDTNAEVNEYSILSTCNPISDLKEAEFFTIPTQSVNIEYTTTDLITGKMLLTESLQSGYTINETESETEIPLPMFKYSSPKPTQDLRNFTGFVDKISKTNLMEISESVSSILASSYVITNGTADSHRAISEKVFDFESNQTSLGEKKQVENLVNKSSKTSSEQNQKKYFSSQMMSYETDSTTRKYMITSKPDHDFSLKSWEDDIDKVTNMPILEKFVILPSKNDFKKNSKNYDFIRTTNIPRRRVKVRISSSTSKSETFQKKSVSSSSSKIKVRVTPSTSMTTKAKKNSDHRKLRRRKKMKKIMIRIRRMFMKLPTTKTSAVLKQSP